ncbi:MAG: hypothetical protein JXQ96_08025 [Cyclobacteriaceae bacterium]
MTRRNKVILNKVSRIKLFALLLLSTIICDQSIAQNFGNEWIDFNQQYVKIEVIENGIHRITYDDLSNAGIPVGSIDPRRVQLFYKGTEQAITIEGQQDGKFDPADYLEFYGQRNDGSSDTDLYIEPGYQPNTYYNLFSDTSAYFLTYKLSAETGLRMTSFFENNVDNLPDEPSYNKEIVALFTNNYHEGRSYGFSNDVVLSQYDAAEGWTGNFATRGNSIDHLIQNIDNRFTTGSKPSIEILLASGNNNQHSAELFVGQSTGSLRSIGTATFNGDENFLFSSEIEWSDISSGGELAVRVTVNGVDGFADRQAISHIRLVYPRTYDLSGLTEEKIELPINVQDKSFIRISNPPADSRIWDITQSSNPVEIEYNSTFQELTAIVSNTTASRTLALESELHSPASIKSVTFTEIDPADYNFTIISNKLLRGNTTNGSADPVNAYKDYRESAPGGSHNVLLLNIDEVYNQFNYGLTSPIAVRRLCDFLLSTGQPEYLFLIGRATNNSYNYFRRDPTTATTNFVPTFGEPGSDAAFSAGLNGTKLDEAIPTGRINAKTPDDVQAYLNKVIESESLVYNDLWHKNIIHLTGGQNEAELVTFQRFGEQFEQIATGPLMGASVTKTSKKTNDAVEFINITKEINEGVSLITFFGHSGASVTDIEVGIVSDPAFGYDNKGRYPIFLVNGCNAGDFFGTGESFGIDWILTPDLGALGFMAHSSIAFSGNLRNYSKLFYEVAYADENFFAQSLGKIRQEIARRYQVNYGDNFFSASQIQQFVMQGDPAIKVFGAEKPDLDIVEENLTTETYTSSPLLAAVDSFYFDIDVKNYGKYSAEPFFVTIKRTLPNGSEIEYGPLEYDPILRQDTLRFNINNQLEEVAGNNTFEIILDEADNIDELDETNNSVKVEIFLATGSTFNILPQDNSIENQGTVDFYFQATDLLSGRREFLIEIDTAASFDSDYLIQRSFTEHVVTKASIDLEQEGALPSGTAIFWRTKFANPLPSEIDDWVTSSFVLQDADEGWIQAHSDQLDEAQSSGLTYDATNGVWDFLSNNTSLQINTFGPTHPSKNYQDVELFLDGINFYETNAPADPGCRNNTLNIVPFDYQSTVPYKPVNFGQADVLNNRVCGKVPQAIHNFTESEFGSGINPEVILDNIKDRDNVLIFSLGTLNYSTWPTTLKDKLVNLGINQSTIDGLEDGEPIIFYGSKGSPQGSATQLLALEAPKGEQELNLLSTISGSFFSGNLTSEIIGPALSYDTFKSEIDIANNNDSEVFDFSIYGVDLQNNEVLLFEHVQDASLDISSIDANTYPYLRLKLDLEDKVDLSPSQLQSWSIVYEHAPEGILLKRDNSGIETSISRQEGQEFRSEFTYWNVSKKNYADSVKLNFQVFNQETSVLYADSLKLQALNAGDSVNFDIDIQTLDRVGTNDLIMKIQTDQKEVHINNNNLRITDFFNVSDDQSNPILEVSFDGVFIMDGDIVSPNPQIKVSMKDENEYLFKDDTTGINISLRRPCDGCDFERVALSSPEITWVAASEDQDFEIDFNPGNLANGMYTLSVQASDETGNESGTEPYEINFEVINESTITNFYPYPNPFSSSTKFVFTLTGNDIPDDIKIQIMTVTGRVVREIFMQELGNIRIGNNITDYAWDGKDEFGDQLANGVYLYKVYLKNNGKEITHRSTSSDQAFKNGFGKLYLLR